MRARLRTRWAVLLSVGACLVVALPSPAGAQDQPQTVQVPPKIVAVDARANTNATVIVRSTEEVVNPQVVVNKTPVEVTGVKKALDAGTKINTVLVIDNSEDSGTFAFKEIKSAATNFLNSVKPGESVAVVSLGGTARIEKELTQNTAIASQIVTDLKPVGATEVWSGFTLAADLLASESTAVNNVIALVASQDSGTNAKVTSAISRSLSNRVAVNVIAVRSGRVSDQQIGELSQLAQETGGLMQATTQPSLLPPLFAAASNAVHGLYAVSIIGDALAPGGNLQMLVNNTELEVGFIAGSVTRGANLAPFKESKSVLPFLQTGKGKLLSLVMMFTAIALGIWAIGTSVVREDTGLNSALSPYVDGDGDDVVGRHSAIFQRAVDITGGIAERRGFLTTAENKLDQASMPLRAAEALTLYAVFIGGVFLASVLLTRSPIKILIMTVVGALLPTAYVNFKISRRKKKFMNQLPDTLGLLAGTLKAGYSFMQGVEAVSQEVEDPMGVELRRVVSEAQLGRPVEDALESAAERMESEDFAWAVMAVKIQREVGGNLAELLLTVAETMTSRSRLRGEIKALTAEGRMSAIILGILPPGVGAVMYVLNREYMVVLFHESIGVAMLVAAVVSMIAGFAWMLKIINIKI
ncbi:MAG: type II secretion system F family protein [Acidimicrobiales bacterium]